MPPAVFQVAILADRADDSAALAHALDAAVRADLPAGRAWRLQGRTELQAHVLTAACTGAEIALTSPTGAGAAPDPGRDAIEAAARRHAATYQLTLLGGLEGPAPDAPAEALHARLRRALHAGQIPYQVLYGDMPARVQQASRALMALAGVRQSTAANEAQQAPASVADRRLRMRNWACEKCSDPECEHQLFQRLIAAR
mgnify:CR=1 FL=1